MNPSLMLVLAVAAAPGEPDVRPPAPVARVPAAADPGRADALAKYGAGRLGVIRDRPPAAVKNLEAAAAADPGAVAPLRDLVPVYIDLGRDPAAIRTARKVLAADPADADTGHTLGRLLFAAARYKEAGDVLRAAADSPRLDPRPTKRLAVLRDLARCREAGGDPAAAADGLRAVAAFLDASRAALVKDGFAPAELDRQAADAAERLGRALVKQKQSGEAIDAFGAAHRLYADPRRANDPAGAARLAWNLSEAHAARGDTAAALADLTAYLDRVKALGLRPAGAEPYERYADLLRRLGRDRDVVPTLRALAADAPADAAVAWVVVVEEARADPAAGYAGVARVARQSRDSAFYRAAVRVYAAADRPRALLDLLDQAFTTARPKGEEEEGEAADRPAAGDRARLLSEAVAAEPAVVPALLRQAGADLRVGTARRAETVELLAWLAERSDRLDKAEDLLRQAVRGPAAEKLAVPQALIRLLAAQKRWEDVIAECEAGQRRQKKFFLYYFAKAEAEVELGQPDAALRTIDAIMNDGKFQARREKARVLGMLGRYKEMVAECEATMQEFTGPDERRAMRYMLSDAYLGLRQFDRAEAELRTVLEDDPDDALALNNLGYNLADQGRKLDEAEALVRRAIELERDERARAGFARPEPAAYLDSLGWVLFRRGKLAAARAELERAADLPDGASDPTVWDHLGDVCFRLGDRPAARAAWGKAAGLYENTHQGRQYGRLDEVKRKLKLTE